MLGQGLSASLPIALALSAIAAVEPRRCTRDAIRAVRARIDRPCTLFAFGKAARGMAYAALEELEIARGIVIALDDDPIDALRVLRGEHPMPALDAAAHGAEVEALARSLGAEDLALVLISGGGSAMLELPVEGVSLAEIAATSRALMRAGADIAELNAVRRCLSRLKGGGLAHALRPARALAIVISDVPGRDASLVASGPCSHPGAWPDARRVIAARGVERVLPASVRAAITSRGELVADDDFERVELVVAADVRTAIEGARAEGARRGLRLGVSDAILTGEASIEGPRFADEARRRCAALGLDGWIAGGETTVTLRGNGRGGRGSEAALAVAARETPMDGAFVAIATDGIDGSSEAAAVWVDDRLRAEAAARALDARALLADNDSHAYFAAIDAQLVTGPTGTNVADVWIWIARTHAAS